MDENQQQPFLFNNDAIVYENNNISIESINEIINENNNNNSCCSANETSFNRFDEMRINGLYRAIKRETLFKVKKSSKKVARQAALSKLSDNELMQLTTLKRQRKVTNGSKVEEEEENNESNEQNLKPNESFSQLIINALSEADDYSLQLRDIYNYIIEKYKILNFIIFFFICY